MLQSATERARPPMTAPRDGQTGQATQPLILIVEDEVALVTLLRYNLEREGFRVLEAGNGEEALLLIKEQRPDLVLLDWMLPILSGIEICRQIRFDGAQYRRDIGHRAVRG